MARVCILPKAGAVLRPPAVRGEAPSSADEPPSEAKAVRIAPPAPQDPLRSEGDFRCEAQGKVAFGPGGGGYHLERRLVAPKVLASAGRVVERLRSRLAPTRRSEILDFELRRPSAP